MSAGGPRVVVCGEAVVDLVADGPRRWASHPGGSPLNVAVGLARLGVPAAFLGRLAGDPFGRMLRAHLQDAGVDLALAVEADEPSTLAVVTVDADGVAAYDFWTEGTADGRWTEAELARPLPAGTAALHTGSMALEMAPGAARVTALVERVAGEVLVSYDPNVRLARRGDREVELARVEHLVGLAGVVTVSSEDLAWLLPGAPAAQVLARWRALGPALVVVTDGPHGALAMGRPGLVRVPAVPVRVVDTVGAGDAFSAGLLAGLDDEGLLDRDALERTDAATLTRVLGLAARTAALTCGRAGADPPTRAEL